MFARCRHKTLTTPIGRDNLFRRCIQPKLVVHRDLKPGNIMLTKAGAKLLDFGLAKLRNDAGAVVPRSQMPTGGATSFNLTAEGTILRTMQYMAPEQLEGKDADARTDIFAFGAVLYEMVTGKKAFEGKSQASLIGAIMTAEPPPVSTIEPMSPPALGHVLKTCLAKDPDERWQTAHEKRRHELARLQTPPSAVYESHYSHRGLL